MPAATCIRCFAVFHSDEARPGVAPVCPSCAAVQAPASPIRPDLAAEPSPGRRPFPLRRAAVALAMVVCAALLAAGVLAAVKALAPRHATPSPDSAAPTAGEEAVAAWRTAGLLPAAVPGEQAGPAAVDERIAAGRAALAADRSRGAEEAMRAFREALALAPGNAEAAAGYAIALAEGGLDGVEGEELARAHALLREALARRGGDPRLLAGYARLLLSVPSARNLAEARQVAARARATAPADPDVALAAGLAEARVDPAAGARTLAAAARPQGDRRLLSAAARAAWQAGDATGALALASSRLELDPDHAGALALTAEVLAATDRIEDAGAVLARWAKAHPDAAEPLLLEARLRYQVERDLAAARRLLSAALARNPDDFLAARILAHRAAVERDAGDAAAARTAVADGLRRVPASAPVQYQAALLAFEARDAAAFREAAGTLGDRAGPLVAADLSARGLELAGQQRDAQAAYLALAGRVSSDPRALLEVAGSLARMRAPGPALEVAQRALRRDLADSRLSRVPTDFWGGPIALAAAAQRFRELARAESRVPGTAFSAAAACELLLGHLQDAEELARAGEAADPQAAAGRFLQAQVALDLAQIARALPLARAAVDAAEPDAPAQATLGRALEASGRLDDAVRAYRGALAAAPDLVAARLALARILARRGDAAAGRTLLAALQRDAPEVPAVRRALLDLGSGQP